jgi:hypoxanthine-DNA glycosylase
LILGTFPSPSSRENGFCYGHPRNRFWKTLSFILDKPLPQDKNSKIKFLLDNNIALWDVIHSCEIEGASDNSIKHVKPNKFKPLIKKSKITAIFTNGKKATELFQKLCIKETGITPIYLPSTSPANVKAQKSEEFLKQWALIGSFLNAQQ